MCCKMKVLTLNAHSIKDAAYEERLQKVVGFLAKEQPDVTAFQEANQLAGIDDNFAMQVAEGLRQNGISCSWVWLPVKRGYGIYHEGVAILSIGHRIGEVDAFRISQTDDYENWRRRAVLGVRLQDEKDWLMGDFNADGGVRNEGYDRMTESEWWDTYQLARNRDDGITVSGSIDGWEGCEKPKRLDQIWCSERCEILSSHVVLNGERGAVVSDHYGVMIEIL